MRGIWAGLITVMVICGFGCAFLGSLIPSVEKYARLTGAAYILWLGFKTLTRPVSSSDPKSEKAVPLRFINGFLLQFLNVKILMLGIAAYCRAAAGSLLFPVYRRHYRAFNVIMALLLFWCVYKILFI